MQSESNSDFHIIRTTTAPREHFLVGRGIAVELELAESIAEYTCIHFYLPAECRESTFPLVKAANHMGPM